MSLKISIISSNNFNKYASTLVNMLYSNGISVDSIIIIKESKIKSIKRTLRQIGFKNTIRKIIQHLGASGSADPKDYLKEYAESKEVNFRYSPLSSLCKEKGIELLEDSNINSTEAIRTLKNRNTDILINCGRGLFRKGIIKAMKLGIFNAHMGILPEFRGMNVLEWSLFYNKKIGVTLHYIAPGIDTGDILSIKHIPIEKGELINDLRDKSIAINVELIVAELLKMEEDKQIKIPQYPHEGKQYFAMHPRLKKQVELKLS